MKIHLIYIRIDRSDLLLVVVVVVIPTQGALQLQGLEREVPRDGRLQPILLRGDRVLRGQRWRRGAGGPQGGQLADMEAAVRVVGRRLEDRPRPPAEGAPLAARPQRLWQDSGGLRRHPGQLEGQCRLPYHRSVPLRSHADRDNEHFLLTPYLMHVYPTQSTCIGVEWNVIYPLQHMWIEMNICASKQGLIWFDIFFFNRVIEILTCNVYFLRSF